LRSRGIDELSARSLLTLAFVSEVIDTIGNEHLREQINDMVHSRLEDWLGVFS
jgi:Fe-S cluster assembly protein SufD